MAKWKLPEGREPITTMDSADLVLRMHDKLAAGFAKGDRIARLEELYEAALEDAKEAEAYAEELEAKLEKAVGNLASVMARYDTFREDEYEVGLAPLDGAIETARTTLAELKGQDDG